MGAGGGAGAVGGGGLDLARTLSAGLEYPRPFEDEEKWTGFQLSSPDLEQAVLAFARKGSVREERMKAVILGTPRYRQHMTLEVSRHEGAEEALFGIECCHAIGWVVGERPVEEIWEEESLSLFWKRED